MVNILVPVVNTFRNPDRHANKTVRRAYMREYMRRRSARISDEGLAGTSAEATAQDDAGIITPEFAALSPTVQAALTITALDAQRETHEPLDINVLLDLLVKSTKKFHYNDIRGLECGLLGQASTLNLTFNQFVRRGCAAYASDQRESEFRIAFRAQSQYRATLATLAQIKNPSSVAFVNQANITNGPQQVNNSVPGPSRRRRKVKNRQSKLSGAPNELLPNPGASTAAVGDDSPMETVAAVNGAEIERG